MFEDLVGYANHVGLFSEEISKSGEALGDEAYSKRKRQEPDSPFPQAIHPRRSPTSAAFRLHSTWTGC